MLVTQKLEYKALTQAVMVANSFDREQAEWALEDVMADIEQGEASYASAATKLGLSVRHGQCGFDAADYLSTLV